MVINERIWKFIDKILPYKKLRPEWLSFDSSVLTRYVNHEGAKKGYNPKKPGRNSHNPIAFLNKSRYVLNIWNRSGNSSSANNVVNFFKETYERIKGKIYLEGIIADSGFIIKIS